MFHLLEDHSSRVSSSLHHSSDNRSANKNSFTPITQAGNANPTVSTLLSPNNNMILPPVSSLLSYQDNNIHSINNDIVSIPSIKESNVSYRSSIMINKPNTVGVLPVVHNNNVVLPKIYHKEELPINNLLPCSSPSAMTDNSNSILPPPSTLLPPLMNTHHQFRNVESNNCILPPPSMISPNNVGSVKPSVPSDAMLNNIPPVQQILSNETVGIMGPPPTTSTNKSSKKALEHEQQKALFQQMIHNVIAKENKTVVKLNAEQQKQLLTKVLKYKHVSHSLFQSNKPYHLLTAKLQEKDKILDVFILARKKKQGNTNPLNIGYKRNSVDDYSFNIVVLTSKEPHFVNTNIINQENK
ncbi:hypothetical protein ABK040_004123 [Willaertia magna]